MLKVLNVIYLISLILLSSGCSGTVGSFDFFTPTPMDEDVARSSEGMYRFMVGELAVKNDDIPAAIENFTKANQSQLSPIPRVSQRLALLQYKAGDLDAALKESEKAVLISPADYNNWLIHGGILESKQEYEEALKSYNKASEIAPAAPEPELLKASLLYRLDRKEEARNSLEKFVSINPNAPSVLAMLGRFYDELNNRPKAEKYLKQAWDSSKDDSTIGFDLIRIYLSNQKPLEAKTVVQQLIQVSPKDFQARRTYAQILYNEDDLDGAIGQLNAAVPLASDPTEVEYEIALILIKQNKGNKAVPILAKILGKYPNNSSVRFTLANLYASLKDFNAALSQLEKIKNSDKEYDRSLVLKSLLLFQINKADKALSIIQNMRKKTYEDPQLNQEYLSKLEKLFSDNDVIDDVE